VNSIEAVSTRLLGMGESVLSVAGR